MNVYSWCCSIVREQMFECLCEAVVFDSLDCPQEEFSVLKLN